MCVSLSSFCRGAPLARAADSGETRTHYRTRAATRPRRVYPNLHGVAAVASRCPEWENTPVVERHARARANLERRRSFSRFLAASAQIDTQLTRVNVRARARDTVRSHENKHLLCACMCLFMSERKLCLSLSLSHSRVDSVVKVFHFYSRSFPFVLR